MKPVVHSRENVPYIRISDLPTEEQERFKTWLRGQTCPLIEGEERGDTAWPWDYERFFRQKFA